MRDDKDNNHRGSLESLLEEQRLDKEKKFKKRRNISILIAFTIVCAGVAFVLHPEGSNKLGVCYIILGVLLGAVKITVTTK